MTRLAAAQGWLRRSAEAAPVAWRQDRLFRAAAVGAGVTLAVLLVRPGASCQDRPLPPLDTAPAGMPSALGLVGRGAVLSAKAPPGEMPKIAPGHPLIDVTVVPSLAFQAPTRLEPWPASLGLDGDRFGTFESGRHRSRHP